MPKTIAPQGRKPLTDAIASETVGFRLDQEHRKLLEQRARKAGASPHEIARAYVIEALHEHEEMQTMRQTMIAIQGELAALRTELAHAVEAILVTGNQV